MTDGRITPAPASEPDRQRRWTISPGGGDAPPGTRAAALAAGIPSSTPGAEDEPGGRALNARRVRASLGMFLVVALAFFAFAACEVAPAASGDYSVNVNGSVGAVTVHGATTGSTSTYTVSVKSPFKLRGSSCSLTPGTVIATFTGAGPAFSGRYHTFNPTTCAQIGSLGRNPEATLNSDNSLRVILFSATSAGYDTVSLIRTGDGSAVPNRQAAGDYSVNVNGSLGAVTVHGAGTGSASAYTVSVKTPFKLDGATCKLTPGTVIATFTGAGPAFSGRYHTFNPTTCAQISSLGSNPEATLNTDNTVSIFLGSNQPTTGYSNILLTGHS